MVQSRYIDAIKTCLKGQRVTYAELAAALRMSESGVKKMLNAKDLSLGRVIQICDAMSILPGDLFKLAESSAIPEVALTAERETALLESRDLLAIYWKLVVEKQSEAQIAKAQRSTAAQLRTRLERLSRLGLVVKKGERYRPIHRGKFRWRDDSALAKRLNEEWSELTIKRALGAKTDPLAAHRLTVQTLTPDSIQRLQRDLLDRLDQAARASEREEVTCHPSQLKRVALLVATSNGNMFDPQTP